MLSQGGAVRSQSVLQSQVGAWDAGALQQATHYLHTQQSPAPDTYEAEAAAQDEQPVVSNPAMMQRLSVMARQPADAPSLRPFNMLGTPSMQPMGSPSIGPIGSLGTHQLGSLSCGIPMGLGPGSLQAMHSMGTSQTMHQASEESAGPDGDRQARLQAEPELGTWLTQQPVGSSEADAYMDWTAGAEHADGVPPLASPSFVVQQSQPREHAAAPRASTSSSNSSNPFPGFQPVGRSDEPCGQLSQPPAGSSGRSPLRQARPSRTSALLVDPGSVSFERALMQQARNSAAAAVDKQDLPGRLPLGHSTTAARWPAVDADVQLSQKQSQKLAQAGGEHALRDQAEAQDASKEGAGLRKSGFQALTQRASQARVKAGAGMMQRIRVSLFGGKAAAAAAAAAAQPGQVCGAMLFLEHAFRVVPVCFSVQG